MIFQENFLASSLGFLRRCAVQPHNRTQKKAEVKPRPFSMNKQNKLLSSIFSNHLDLIQNGNKGVVAFSFYSFFNLNTPSL